ncbi:MAG TPA: ABC transporter permease, partial [Niabella sp.]|nr:ABC transporter permease [Niabella sp.]
MLKKRTILPLIPFVFLLLFSLQAKAQRRSKKKKKEVTLQQPSDVIPPYNIDVNRRILHENLDKEQLLLLKSDGIKDSFLTIYEDQRINESITDAVIRKVDRLQYEIETNKNLSGREKIYYLTGLIDILKFVKTGWKKKEIEASYLPQIIFTYKKLIEANAQQQPLAPLIEYLPYDVANTALMSKIFKENPGYDDVLKLLTLSVSQRFPEKTMGMLKNYPDAPFADSLIKLVARKAPQSLYDYAQANNKLSYRIQNIEDDRLVATIGVIVLVSLLVFIIIRLIPGDPITILLGENLTEEARARLVDKWGLDQPVVMQYLRWAGNMLGGDFGVSIRTQESVSQLLRDRIPATLSLASFSLLIAVLFGLPAGVIAAYRANTAVDG